MALEVQPGAHGRAGRGTKKVASLAPHGGGRAATPAARGIPAHPKGSEKSVWAPILLKAVGVLAGMLALAAIGASSIARGAGVPVEVPSARPAPRVAAAGVTPLAQGLDAGGATEPSDGGSDAAAGASEGLTADGKVVLNRASVTELRRIPGVGPKRAQAIVDLRTKLGGRFKRTSELLRVKGIGVKSLKKMEAHMVLDAKR